MERSKENPVLNSDALVVRAGQGDAGAFAELIRRYERMALSVAYGVLANADAAGDEVQEAFLRAWERLGEMKEPGRFSNWLCGIARNLAIDAHRRGRHMKHAADVGGVEAMAVADGHSSADPLDELDRKERDGLVASALASLDETTRPMVIMRYYDGLSSKQIGEALGLSPAAVDMRLSRARQQLKRMLSPAILPVTTEP
ncbi:MAG: polymerase, sigma-24 subunit, subfamily [Phycisphaerales bacterium]|nr:polymerase, sigma-24 subunit, subfamily [Phycisphaerales bacterium]